MKRNPRVVAVQQALKGTPRKKYRQKEWNRPDNNVSKNVGSVGGRLQKGVFFFSSEEKCLLETYGGKARKVTV